MAELQDLDREISAALRAQKFGAVKELQRRREQVGAFLSIFAHDPGEEISALYPTVRQDLGQMIKIGRISQSFLKEHLSPREQLSEIR